ncbi:Uracil DNA glycosylase superfamily protein [Pirellulimonas nuda]|uniref:Type-4 uracil-DNA glycosylase n=1 Tax=Pirellulimonas nuda TaxID=2528009 RepID=A0A518DGE5_9BACT|nr:uracil-DNA glycosylase [Pirellulimonas nuda]QDU90512.1 Uracil DNA glycosylase superfamily protein [Pirellulimonas nuda]
MPRALVQRLEDLLAAGVSHVPRPPAAAQAPPLAAPTPRPAAEYTAARAASPAQTEPRPEAAATGGDSVAPADAASLSVLQAQVSGCTRCGELARTRTQTVFGVGNPEARLCFLGEAPGADEDRTGEPFVGKAGQLLTKIIEACGMTRDEVYILNVLKCRPPGNRNPLPEESHNCRPFLLGQFDLIRPEFVCCLGAVAAQNLLETTTTIGRLRGQMHDWRGVKVACTYHPAYLLRNPAAKADTWEDMKRLMAAMGRPVA